MRSALVAVAALACMGMAMGSSAAEEGGIGHEDFLTRLMKHGIQVRQAHAAHRGMMGKGLVPPSELGEVALRTIYQSVAEEGEGEAAAAGNIYEGGGASPLHPGVNPNCPEGSIAHNMPGFSNVCVWKPASSLDWNKAEALCQSTGRGHIASFANMHELFFIQSVVSFTETFWVGLKRTASEGGSDAGWTFSDGTNPIYATTLWAPGQPNNIGGDQNCAEMISTGGTGETNRVNDMKCSQENPFVCLKIAPEGKPDAPEGGAPAGDGSGVGGGSGAAVVDDVPPV